MTTLAAPTLAARPVEAPKAPKAEQVEPEIRIAHPRREAVTSRGLAIGLSGLVILVAVMGRLVYVSLPFDGDGAMFAYMGKLVADGGRFGIDLVDNKFPTVGLITSVFWRAFGDAWAGYVLAQLAMTMLAAGLLARQAGRSFGTHATWAAFLPAVTLLNLNAAVMGGFQLETILAFFACVSACCGLEALRSGDARDAIATGLAAGCAAMVKPTGIGVLGALGLALVVVAMINPRRRVVAIRLIAWSLAGAGIPVLVSILYLQRTETLALLPTIAAQIGEYAANSSFDPIDLFRPISLVVLFASAVAVRGWVYRRPAYRVESRAGLAEWVFVIAWLTIELIGVLMQRRMYAYHFLPLACPAALAFAAIARRATLGQLAGVLTIPVLISTWGTIDTWRAARANPPTWPAVAQWLDRHTAPGERVWRDVTPAILIPSDLRPASRVQLTFLFMNSDEAPDRFAGMLLEDLRRHRPRYVVLPADVSRHVALQSSCVFELSREPRRAERFADAWDRIAGFVERRYDRVAEIGTEAIYQRREEAQR